jgi:hypothetical protein
MLNYLILGALFFVLSPGNFLTLPRGGSKMTVALVHALLFVVAFASVQYVFGDFTEGFQGMPRHTYGKWQIDNAKMVNDSILAKNHLVNGCQTPNECVRGKGWTASTIFCKCKNKANQLFFAGNTDKNLLGFLDPMHRF